MKKRDRRIYRAILKDRSFRLSILLTFIFLGIGVAFLFLGLVDYSWVLFILLPTALGIAVGSLPVRKYTLLGVIGSVFITLIALYIPGLSGFICIVMALGLIAPFILLGHVIVRLSIRLGEIKKENGLSVLLLPLIPFLIAAPAEHFLKKDKDAIVTVTTEQIFNYTPELVYYAIKSVDTLDAEKPFLMYFDLPVPTKCVLEKEEVGGTRTCYFSQGNLSNFDFGGGTITEKITQLERGKILKMEVTDCNIIGRKWLGFKEAIYYFEKSGEQGC
ncbi:MAG TPA: polyketide cyclase, partial [Chitinophagaceae bacterium]|nr:polyketide cyclase [Chitinophagaceae bacterium]